MSTLPPIPTEIRRDFSIETQSWLEETRRILNSISAASGEANTASNLGSGEGVWSTKAGVDLQFKSLVAGTNLTLSSTDSAITINASNQTTTPAGSDTHVQFNDGGSFGGSANLTWDDTTLAVTGALTVSTTATVTGVLSVDDTTDSTSGVTGSIHTDGGLGVVKDLWVASKATIGGTANETQLTVTGNASQTATLADFNDSGGTQQLGVAANGAIQMGDVDVFRATDAQTSSTNCLTLGEGAGDSLSGASAVMCIGKDAGTAITSASTVFAIGPDAAKSLLTGNNNFAIGSQALFSCTTGTLNLAIGNNALKDLVTAGSCTAFGNNALENTTADSNTAMGAAAGRFNTTGKRNCYFGDSAGEAVTAGNDNIAIGAGALDKTGTFSNNIMIGFGASE